MSELDLSANAYRRWFKRTRSYQKQFRCAQSFVAENAFQVVAFDTGLSVLLTGLTHNISAKFFL